MFRKSWTGLALGALMALPAHAQTVDELIAKHVEAKGGMTKMKAIQTLRMSGRMTVGPGVEAPLAIELKRPNNLRLETQIQGNVAVQAYDGKVGWEIAPFGGKRAPEPMSIEDLKDMQEQADIDGPLVDYKAKGHKVELAGKEKIEGSDAFKLKLTRSNGDVEYIYLDADTFLDVRSESKRIIRGSEVETETTIGDFKEEGGVMLPHSYQNSVKGRPEKQNIVVEKVEVNPVIADARFKMPEAPKPAEAKP